MRSTAITKSSPVQWRNAAAMLGGGLYVASVAIWHPLHEGLFGGTVLAVTHPLGHAIHHAPELPAYLLLAVGLLGLSRQLTHQLPDGHFVPRWTRWLALGWVLFRLPGIFFPLSPFDKNIGSLTGLVWIGFLGGLVVAQVYRYRHVSTPIQRQQTRWIVFGLSVAIAGFLGIVFGWRLLAPTLLFDLSSPYTWAAITVIDVLWLLVPSSMGLAILRYRLWDIDLLINRTLVYSLLTASIVGLYVLLIGGLSTLFQTSGNFLISLLATAVVAMLFAPLRDRLQRTINRLLYGQRDDPYAILSRLGRQLEATLAPDAVLPAIVTTIHDALKLPYVAIALDQEGQSIEAAAAGRPAPNPLWLPLNYQGETIGGLILAPRTSSEAFTPAERRLLEDLAHHSGVAAAAVRLTADLQRSRERLVTAREEERRRLRRDLHDGLGPQLAAQTLKLEAARDLLYANPQRAETLITGLIEKSQGLIAEIRRVVYALRPPALDELGLLGAVRELTNHGELNGLQITLSTPQHLPPLPAAVEVAAYRIVQEALTNVIRHAHARTCLITLAFIEQPAALHIEVCDDGRGLSPEYRAGVGLNSMRERAEELGGEWRVETRIDGGTQVLACLPLSRN